jgi:DNA repair ATPase RecN
VGACEKQTVVDKTAQRQALDAYLAGFEKLRLELRSRMTAALKAQHEFKGGPDERAALTARTDQVLATMQDLTRRLEALDAPGPELHRLRETHLRMFKSITTAFSWAAKAWKAEDEAEQTRCLDEFSKSLEEDAAEAAGQAREQLAAYRKTLR